MPNATPSATMAAGDPPSYWNYPQGDVFKSPDLTDIHKRLEQKIREENSFVRELYEQYKVALALLEDPDE